MDSVTHGLFGVILYRAFDKTGMSKEMKRAMLFTALIGSELPDIDVVSQFWDTQGMYQMWHRGITHSVFLVPAWALLLMAVCWLFWRVKDWRIFYLGLLAVFIHDTSDLFNAWGTGYLEPFSQMRVTFGTIPIVDPTFWAIILGGFLVARWKKGIPVPRIFKGVWLLIAAHVLIQTGQGYAIYQKVDHQYEKVALAADFVPWHFQVIGKGEGVVEISKATAWSEPQLVEQLKTAEDANLDTLFKENPKAKTLMQWAPFVVVVDEDERLGIYDPRFYRNGQSFLFEYMEKQQ